MASGNYIPWPKHRKKAAEQKRRKRRGVTTEDLGRADDDEYSRIRQHKQVSQ